MLEQNIIMLIICGYNKIYNSYSLHVARETVSESVVLPASRNMFLCMFVYMFALLDIVCTLTSAMPQSFEEILHYWAKFETAQQIKTNKRFTEIYGV